MIGKLIIYDSEYLDEQCQRFTAIKGNMARIARYLKRLNDFEGLDCRERDDLTDSLNQDVIKKLTTLKDQVERIVDVLRLASFHTYEDGKKAKLGADAMFEKMKEKYGMEASSYNPEQIFDPSKNKTMPLTTVPALARVIVANIFMRGEESMPWVKNVTLLTVAKAFKYEAEEADTLEKNFEKYDQPIFAILYKSNLQMQYSSALKSLAVDA